MSEWISVEEQLPEDTKIVQISVLVREGNKAVRGVGLGAYIISAQEWRIAELNRVIDGNDKVTHWMPLPEPPEDK